MHIRLLKTLTPAQRIDRALANLDNLTIRTQQGEYPADTRKWCATLAEIKKRELLRQK